jgi:hypothetical protein
MKAIVGGHIDDVGVRDPAGGSQLLDLPARLTAPGHKYLRSVLAHVYAPV